MLGWQGRGRGLRARPQPLAGVCTPTRAHMHTCTRTHTQEASWTLAHFPRRQALHLILPPSSLHGFSGPAPGALQPILLLADRVAPLLTEPSLGSQDQPTAVTMASKLLCPAPAPPPAFTLHRPSAVFAPATLASLPLLCAPAFAHVLPSTWNTFLSHPPGRLPCITQLSCHFLRTSRVPIGPLSQGLWPPTLCPHGVAFPSPLSYAFQG